VRARTQWTIIGGVVALLAIAVAAVLHFSGDEFFPVSVGSKAPDFRALAVQERGALLPTLPPRTLDSYKGQVVLLNIWATWCGPCVIEMPAIEKLHDALGPKGLHVVAVSVDNNGQFAEQAIREFVKQHALTFDVLHDTTHHPPYTQLTKIERSYQTTGVPETFVIGKDGTIRKKIIGAHDWDSPADRTLITQLLAEPGGE
jgi:thiol-disulfide isomerase/thioredoxin